MPSAVIVKLDTREVDRIAAKLGVNRNAIVRKAAFEIEAQAKINAPYDTTAMRNSIYTVTGKDDGYSKASGAAMGKGWTQGGRIVDTSPHPKPPEGSAFVGPCVEYAEFVEYGTSKMAAQPFLTPAAEKVEQAYNDGSKWEELTK
jgi:HK97 gp10 family phage protein